MHSFSPKVSATYCNDFLAFSKFDLTMGIAKQKNKRVKV